MKKSSKISTSNRLLRLNTSQYRREYKSGAVYHGELEGNKKSGKGIFKWPNGACYDGEYVDNTRNGCGKQYWPDGSIYDGEFVRDLRHGFGTLTWPDSESYSGDFYRDRKHGKGVYTWPDGTIFDGHFENDKKEGFGTFTFSSGNTFEGIYTRDERDGPGVMTYVNDDQDIGLWCGERLIKLCSVMESAFLFQHYSDYNVNAGQNLSGKVRRANTAREGMRNSPSLQDFESAEEKGSSKLLSQIPNSFPYSDILEGVRGGTALKGPVECASEDLLRSSAAGDCIKVRALIQSGKVHVDVADKTGYTALLAASVNCHRDVINCLLDNGANVNKLNDEGLSVLAACHVLFYTKHTWKDNIAENIPVENLFNCIQEDRQKGTYVHRNCRQNITAENIRVETSVECDDDDDNSEDECRENFENENNEDEVSDQMTYRIIEFTDKTYTSKDDNGDDSENILNESRKHRMNLGTTGFVKDSREQRTGLQNDNQVDSRTSSPGRLTPVSDKLSLLETHGVATGKLNVGTSLFSIMSAVSSTRQLSDSEDVCSENSMEQNKQVLLAVQRRPHLEATVRLLLRRGADPNASSLPMPVLFFAVKAADSATVEILLQKGADTSAKLSKEKLGIAPLHIAVALPDDTGIEITELLLKAGADPNIRDCAFETEENGRTPAHIASSREDNDKVSCAVVHLLLEYGANPDCLCEGHSALSLAICSGNDAAVDTLLEHGANASLCLSRGVGSALCAATSFMAERRRSPAGRIKLINKLMRAEANILSPITVSFKYPPGTVVDYAYNVFYQDRKIAHTPYHALTVTERDCYNARREMLDHLGDLLRTQVLKKEKELIDKQLAEAEKQAEWQKPHTAWGILKPHDPSPTGEKEDSRSPVMGASRVSFRLGNEVFGQAGGEAREVEAQADREVEAITGTDRESPGDDSEEEQNHVTSELSPGPGESKESTPCSTRSSAHAHEAVAKPSSPGRDENCGLRIAVTKAADHMSISALATQALKQRQQVMKNRFRYCYECGRSIGIRLSACTRCKEVFYCSKSCKLKAWNARHREECVRLTGGMKTAANRRAESPTPTTDPDAPPPSTTPSGSQRKSPSRVKGEKGRKPQSPARPTKRNTTSSATKIKK